MVRLGIVSDSHGRDVWLEKYAAVCKRERYDAVIHLGDVEPDAHWLEKHLDMRFFHVPGNCDMFSKSPREMALSFEGRRLLAVHGDRQDVKYGLSRLSYYAEERGAAVALFGHTHEPCAEWMGRVLMLNPGALMNGCYGELILDGQRLVPMLKNLRGERL